MLIEIMVECFASFVGKFLSAILRVQYIQF